MPPPLGGHHLTSGLSTATTRAPSVSGVIGWVLAARRAPPNAGARTSGRWPSMPTGCHPWVTWGDPLGGHRDDGWPQHAHHVRAERAGRDWAGLGTTCSASPRQDAHGLHLREGRAPPWRAVRRTRAPRSPPVSPARARCARRAGAGGSRGAWLPPTTTRIPRRARGARVQALTAPLHTPHGKGVPCPTPNHPRHVQHEREAWAGRVRVGRVAHGYRPRP